MSPSTPVLLPARVLHVVNHLVSRVEPPHVGAGQEDVARMAKDASHNPITHRMPSQSDWRGTSFIFRGVVATPFSTSLSLPLLLALLSKKLWEVDRSWCVGVKLLLGFRIVVCAGATARTRSGIEPPAERRKTARGGKLPVVVVGESASGLGSGECAGTGASIGDRGMDEWMGERESDARTGDGGRPGKASKE